MEEVDWPVLEGEPLGGTPLALRVHPFNRARRHEETLPERHAAFPACRRMGRELQSSERFLVVDCRDNEKERT